MRWDSTELRYSIGDVIIIALFGGVDMDMQVGARLRFAFHPFLTLPA